MNFFAEKLTEAQNVIHIAMAKYASEGYEHAVEAAKSFENVTVLDSGHLSSGMGITVLYAAHMAEQNASREEITEMVEDFQNRVSTSFIMGNTKMLYQGGRISRSIHILCETLLLHPVIKLNKSKMAVGGIMVGNFIHVAKKYIRKTLKNVPDIDKNILFITYAGMDYQSLKEIRNLIQQQCAFKHIYLQKASSAIASNCGPGSFGLLFLRKS